MKYETSLKIATFLYLMIGVATNYTEKTTFKRLINFNQVLFFLLYSALPLSGLKYLLEDENLLLERSYNRAI